MVSLSKTIKDYARELGFSAAGIVPAVPSPHLDAYLGWLERGMHGSIDYMSRSDRVARRKDLTVIMPGAKSLVVVALDYSPGHLPQAALDPARGQISSYAWGQDYHPVMKQHLNALAARIRELRPGSKAKGYVDTGAILERSHAELGRLGFVGKNTMLIHPRRGSSFFLGEVITTLELDYDAPLVGKMPGCGTCTRCLSACPTRAFPEPYILDARRCISYLTIEHQGAFDKSLRALVGNWVYGCDICQEVCPWQRFAKPADRPEFQAVSEDRIAPKLEALLTLSREDFARTFAGSGIVRIGRDKLVGNACVAAGNSGHAELSQYLIPLLTEANPVIRSHAAWALGRLGTGSDALNQARQDELDPRVRIEFEEALAVQSS